MSQVRQRAYRRHHDSAKCQTRDRRAYHPNQFALATGTLSVIGQLGIGE